MSFLYRWSNLRSTVRKWISTNPRDPYSLTYHACFVVHFLVLFHRLTNLLLVQVHIGFYVRKHLQLVPHLTCQFLAFTNHKTSSFLPPPMLSTASSSVTTTLLTTDALVVCHVWSPSLTPSTNHIPNSC